MTTSMTTAAARRAAALPEASHRELWQRMDWLATKIDAGLPADAPATRAVAAMRAADEANGEDDDYLMPLPLLRAVHAEFLALPADVRRRLMGGWTYDPAYPSPAAVRDDEARLCGIAFRYRTLTKVAGGQRAGAFGWAGVGLDGVYPAGVVVELVEGVTQAEAVDTLEAVLRMVRGQWADVTGPDEWVDEKGGSPALASITPAPGSKAGDEVRAATAAA